MGFIRRLSILACSSVILNGSTVNGNVPVSMANRLTPLQVVARDTSPFYPVRFCSIYVLYFIKVLTCTCMYMHVENQEAGEGERGGGGGETTA